MPLSPSLIFSLQLKWSSLCLGESCLQLPIPRKHLYTIVMWWSESLFTAVKIQKYHIRTHIHSLGAQVFVLFFFFLQLKLTFLWVDAPVDLIGHLCQVWKLGMSTIINKLGILSNNFSGGITNCCQWATFIPFPQYYPCPQISNLMCLHEHALQHGNCWDMCLHWSGNFSSLIGCCWLLHQMTFSRRTLECNLATVCKLVNVDTSTGDSNYGLHAMGITHWDDMFRYDDRHKASPKNSTEQFCPNECVSYCL